MGAAKRFKRTKRGKFLRSKAFKQHILSSKTTKRKRGLRGTTTVADVDAPKLAQDAAIQVRESEHSATMAFLHCVSALELSVRSRRCRA